jgi:3-oxoacyl-[acyl-carrier protein] reductase
VDLGLTGKVAMVGGASRGLGFAVAQALAREGARVSLASRQASAARDAAQRLASDTGADVAGFEANLSRAAAIEAWHASTIERFGGVDLLHVNTGGPPAGPVLSFDDAAWQAAVDLLLFSAIRLVRATVPAMRARGSGAVLFSTSSSVKEPIPNLALSNVVRASVAALAKTLAHELAPARIRVNCLVPGRIDTDRVRELDTMRARQAGVSVEEQRAIGQRAVPLGRYGDPEEFGRAAAFLLSDVSSYTTGATLQVDGGLIKSVW